MKKIYIGRANQIFLDAPDTNETGLTVALTIVGEDAQPLTKSDDTACTDLACAFSDDENKYGLTITLKSTTPSQYARLYWKVTDSALAVELPEDFSPEEIQLLPVDAAISQIAVPTQYFLDYSLAAMSKLDTRYALSVKTYPRDGIIRGLLAAQANIQNMMKMDLFLKDHTEFRDYNFDEFFADTFWILQTYHRPITAVKDFSIWHGTKEILTVDPGAIVFEQYQATLEFVPNAFSGGLMFQQLLSGGDAAMLAVIGRLRANRLPLAFHITYTAGLDFPTLADDDKESFRQAVARNALIELLPMIDPAMREVSASDSIDGVSGSTSRQVSQLIKQLEANEEKWLRNIQKKYATGFDMVLA